MELKHNLGYYNVTVEAAEGTLVYRVQAQSDYHAARLVRAETGYLPLPQNIEGPLPL